MRLLELLTLFKEMSMFYMLERRVEAEATYFCQRGIVVAESIEKAAAKLGLTIKSVVIPPESVVACAQLERGYWLEEVEEITSLEE